MRTTMILAFAAGLTMSVASAQALPDPAWPDLRPELRDYRCEDRQDDDSSGDDHSDDDSSGNDPQDDESRREPITEAERARYAMRARYREYFPVYLARVGPEPATELVMPVDGVSLGQIADTYGAPRWDRSHEGLDIFAPRDTPVRAAAPGFVYRIDDLSLGGLSVTVVGGGGVRYFYTHFESVPDELTEGQRVETGDLIGYVGNSGNAAGTPPHLHFGVYHGEDGDLCEWRAVNPLPILRDRP